MPVIVLVIEKAKMRGLIFECNGRFCPLEGNNTQTITTARQISSTSYLTKECSTAAHDPAEKVWDKVSQQVLSTDGNCFRNVGKPPWGTMR